MTQPDGLFPPSAINFDSIAALAALTENDVQDNITNQALSGHRNVMTQTYDVNGLPTDTGANLTSVLIGSLFETLCGCNPGGLDLGSTIDNLGTQANDTIPGGLQHNSSPLGINILQTLFGFCCGCDPGGSTFTEFSDNTKAQVSDLTGIPIESDDPAAISATKSLFQRFTPFKPTGSNAPELLDSIEGINDNMQPGHLNYLPVFGVMMRGLSGGGVPVHANNVFGSIRSAAMSRIPVGSLTDKQVNLLPSPTFEADSVAESADWSIDVASTRTAGSGAVTVTADGYPHALRSGITPTDIISVSAGQTITSTIYVKHTGYVGSGATIFLQVVPFVDDSQDLEVTVDSYAPEGAVVTSASYYATVPFTVPGVLSYHAPSTTAMDVDWPGHQLTGSYVVPEGVTGIQFRIFVSAGAKAGVIQFDDADMEQTGKLKKKWVFGLEDDLQLGTDRMQLARDAVVNMLTKTRSAHNGWFNFGKALTEIKPDNVVGVGGQPDIGESVWEALRSLGGGMTGTPGTKVSFADMFNLAKQTSSRASLGEMSFNLLSIRTNKPGDKGFLASGTSNFVNTGIDTSIAATQAASVIATHHIEVSQPLGVVSWLGYGIAGLTAFYVNIWKIDSAGDWSLAHHSPNIVSDLAAGGTPQWNFYELANPLATVASEDYAYELVPVGATHNVSGKVVSLTNIPIHPFAPVVALAATRNNTSPDSPPSTIAKASVTRSANVPWIETAIDLGMQGDYHVPKLILLTNPGNHIVAIQPWANEIHVIGVSAGGGGRVGTVISYGEPGQSGSWGIVKWLRGADFDDSVDTIDVTVPAGGTGGAPFSPVGQSGGGLSVSIPGHALTIAGGSGGDTLLPGLRVPPVGKGPQPATFNYNDENYAGGGDQSVISGPGAAPGGAGNGGGLFRAGDGASGAVWIVQLTGDIPDTGTDTTPPTAPSSVSVATTFSTITASASGGTD